MFFYKALNILSCSFKFIKKSAFKVIWYRIKNRIKLIDEAICIYNSNLVLNFSIVLIWGGVMLQKIIFMLKNCTSVYKYCFKKYKSYTFW